MNLDLLTDAVLQKLNEGKKRALLIGCAPDVDHNYNYVNEKPYEAVVLGRLSPAQLLHMPDDAVCDALMEDIPVYLWRLQTWQGCKNARGLCRELQSAEQRLFRMGILPMERTQKLLTAQDARRMLQQGETAPHGCRMTPLAKDILEGRSS